MSVNKLHNENLLDIVWRALMPRRWVVVGIVAAFTAAAVAIALLTRPIYRVTALLIPAQSVPASSALSAVLGNLGGLAALGGLDVNGDNSKAEAIAILRSRSFTEAFIRDENLLPVLFADVWDESDGGRWVVSPDEVPSIYDGFRLFDRTIRRVTEDTRSGLVRLDIEWREPELGATWANELVRRMNAQMREHAIAESNASVESLGAELAATNVVSVKQSISSAMEYHVKRRVLAATAPEYAFRTIDPAAPPDADDFVRPQRTLYIGAGFLIGLLVAVGAVLSWEYLAPGGALRGSNFPHL